MRGQSVHAHLGEGRMFDHNCFSNVDVTVGRGTLTLAYEWWEPGKFSVQANIAKGNAIAFFPSDAVFHLIAERFTAELPATSPQKESAVRSQRPRSTCQLTAEAELELKWMQRKAITKLAQKNPNTGCGQK